MLFMSFIITVHPDQADTNCKHILMNFRSCDLLPFGVYGIYASIDIQTLEKPILF